MVSRSSIIAGKTVIVIEAQDAIDKTLRSVRTKMFRFANSINEIGFDLLRGGLLASIPTALATREFQKFEDALLLFQTKIKASDQELKGLTSTIRRLGRTTSFTALEVARAATELGKAAFSPREIQDSLQAVLDLARGAELELASAASILANTIKTFELNTTDAAEVASQFVAAARLGTIDVIDLKESIKEVSGTLVSLNQDLPTTLALLTTLSFSSLKGTKAGTSLNTAILNLAQNAEKLRKVGINFGDPNKIAIIDVLRQLDELTRTMPRLERVAFFQDVFNIRGGRAVTAAVIQGIETMVRRYDEIRQAGDEARQAAITMDSGIGGAMRRATSAVNDFAITLGGIAAGPVTDLLNKVPALVDLLDRFATNNESLTLALLAAGPAALVLGGALLTLGFALTRIASLTRPIQGLLSSLTGLGGAAIRAPLALLPTGRISQFTNNLRRGLRAGLGKGLSAKQLSTAAKSVRFGHNLGTALRTEIQAGAFVRRVGTALAHALSRIFSRLPELARSTGRAASGFASMFNMVAEANAPLQFRKASSGIDDLGKSIRGSFSATDIARFSRARQTLFDFSDSAKFQKGFDFGPGIIPPTSQPVAKKLSTAVDDAVRTAIALTRSKGAIKAEPVLANRVATAIDDVLKAQGIPKQLAPTINRQVSEAVGLASRVPVKSKQVRQLSLGLENQIPLFDKFAEAAERAASPVRTARRPAVGSAISTPIKEIARRESALAKVAAHFRSIGKALAPAATSLGSLLTFTDEVAELGSRPDFSSIFRGFRTGLSALTKVNVLRGVVNVSKGIGTIAKTLLTATAHTTRFIFSLNGLLTILDFFLLFGHKFEFTRNIMEGLADAFTKAFDKIKAIGSLGEASFGLIRSGFSDLFGDDIDAGLDQLGVGFTTLGTIIKSQLVAAWYEFTSGINPAIEALSKVWSTLSEIANLIVEITSSSLGGFFSNLGVSAGALPAPSAAGLNLAKGVGAFFREVGTAILNFINWLQTALSKVMASIAETLASILKTVGSWFPFGGAENEQLTAQGESLSSFAEGLRAHIAAVDTDFEGRIDALNSSFNKFVSNIEARFEEAERAAAQRSARARLAEVDSRVAALDARMEATKQRIAETDRKEGLRRTPFFNTMLGDTAGLLTFTKDIITRNIASMAEGALKNAEAFRAVGLENLARNPDFTDPSHIGKRIVEQAGEQRRSAERFQALGQALESVTVDSLPKLSDIAGEAGEMLGRGARAAIDFISGDKAASAAQEQAAELGKSIASEIGTFQATRRSLLQSFKSPEFEIQKQQLAKLGDIESAIQEGGTF